MTSDFSLPKMKINGYNDVLSFLQIDKFSTKTHNGYMDMTIHQAKDGNKYFVFHTAFQVFGWTANASDAWQAWGNIGIYTNNEIYNAFRGKS